jgi:hypothetical protein
MAHGYTNLRRAAMAWLAAGVLGAAVPARAQSSLDGSKVSWTRLEYTARKIGATATIVVSARAVPVAAAVREWLAASEGSPVVPSGDAVILIESQTSLAGRAFDDRLWLDGSAGGAIQIDDTETGHNVHCRIYRLCREGFVFEERLPGAKEEALAPPQWSRVTRTWHDFPAGLGSPGAVTGPMGLLWAMGAAGGMKAGDALTFPVLVHGQIEEVTLRAEGPAAAEVDWLESTGGRETRVRGLVGVQRVSLTAQPIGAESGSHFRVFGLEGDIQVLWDPRHGLPVELSGDVRFFGHLVIRLVGATLR